MTIKSALLLSLVLATLGPITTPSVAGELDPPASALTPQGTPAPTMKSLAVPPSWDQTLSALGPVINTTTGERDSCNSPRFKCVLGSGGVLDRETGLVWQRQVSIAVMGGNTAEVECLDTTIGGRKGWRLPRLEELLTLVDPGVAAPGPVLPPGHPFIDVQQAGYSVVVVFANAAQWQVIHDSVDFSTGRPGGAGDRHFWCLRGPVGR